MDTSAHFVAFKEKVIKTNELLQVFASKNEECKKACFMYKNLKAKLEQAESEVAQMKMKNETLTFSLGLLERDYQPLKEKHEKLKQDFEIVEAESSKIVNNLQINYQLANKELQDCKTTLSALQSSLSSKSLIEEDGKITKELEQQIKVKKEKIKDFEDQLKFKQSELQNLRTDYQLSITSKDNEIKRLSMDLIAIKTGTLKNLEQKLDLKKKEFCNLKTDFYSDIASKDTVINKQSKTIQQLIFQLNSNQVPIFEKKEKGEKQMKSAQEDIENRESLKNDNDMMPSDGYVQEILKELLLPSIVSPILQTDNSAETQASCIQESMTNSSDRFMECETQTEESTQSNDTKSDLMRRALTERLCRNKKKRRPKHNSLDLYKMLLQLKRAKINCHISNESFIRYNDPYVRISRRPCVSLNNSHEKKLEEYTKYEELKCSLPNCKSVMARMIMKKENESNLLGFVEIKDEVKNHQEESSFHQLQTLSFETQQKTIDRCLGFKRKLVEEKSKLSDDKCVETVPFKRAKIPTGRLSRNNKTDRLKNSRRKNLLSSEFLPLVQDLTPKLCKNNEENAEHIQKRIENVDVLPVNNAGEKVMHNISKNLSVACTNNIKLGTSMSGMIVKDIEKETDFETSDNQRIAQEEEEECGLSFCSESGSTSTINKRLPCKNDSNLPTGLGPVEASGLTSCSETKFKKPMCFIRRSVRIYESKKLHEQKAFDDNSLSPNLNSSARNSTNQPVIQTNSTVPRLEFEETEPQSLNTDIEKKTALTSKKMATSKIEALFKKLIVFSKEEEVLNDVANQFRTQEPGYVSEAILQRISVDFYDKTTSEPCRAPLLTDVQRTMLGFMVKLEKITANGILDKFLFLAEQKLLTCDSVQVMIPITRLYLAVCRMQKNLFRLRKLCCDIFYFCGDLALPFFFTVLTSWTEVLPQAINCDKMPLAKVMVQTILTSSCSKPGYNFLPLRDLLVKFYGYPVERWDVNIFFEDLLNAFLGNMLLENPSRSSDFALLLYCKNQPEKWVYGKIEEHLKPIILNDLPIENVKATTIILIGNLCNRFNSKSEPNYLEEIRLWFKSLISEKTPVVIKRSVYLCLNRLKKK